MSLKPDKPFPEPVIDQAHRERIVEAYIAHMGDTHINYYDLAGAEDMSPIRAFIRNCQQYRFYRRHLTDEELCGSLPHYAWKEQHWQQTAAFTNWAIRDDDGWPVMEKFIKRFAQDPIVASCPPLPWLVAVLDAEEVTGDAHEQAFHGLAGR